MALVKANLEAQLKVLFTTLSQSENPEQSISDLASGMATIIDGYIKTATVNPGIQVSTAGGPTAQTGVTTTPGTIS